MNTNKENLYKKVVKSPKLPDFKTLLIIQHKGEKFNRPRFIYCLKIKIRRDS